MRLIGHLRQQQKIVAPEALGGLPVVAVGVEPRKGDVVPRLIGGAVPPDRGFDGPMRISVMGFCEDMMFDPPELKGLNFVAHKPARQRQALWEGDSPGAGGDRPARHKAARRTEPAKRVSPLGREVRRATVAASGRRHIVGTEPILRSGHALDWRTRRGATRWLAPALGVHHGKELPGEGGRSPISRARIARDGAARGDPEGEAPTSCRSHNPS